AGCEQADAGEDHQARTDPGHDRGGHHATGALIGVEGGVCVRRCSGSRVTGLRCRRWLSGCSVLPGSGVLPGLLPRLLAVTRLRLAGLALWLAVAGLCLAWLLPRLAVARLLLVRLLFGRVRVRHVSSCGVGSS